jgi:predicted transposase/invertase (TIGR01784 family)
MSKRGAPNPETDMPPKDPTDLRNSVLNPIPEGGVGISPRVDLVFQRIFGAPGHEPLLIDLLNSVLRPARPVVEVQLLNPVLSPKTHDGRLVIVDLVAIDDRGAHVQVEMQTTAGAHLRKRMLHGWASLYARQLSAGQGFDALRPVISLWFCDRDVLPPPPPVRARPFHARFEVAEVDGGPTFLDHFSLHVVELSRFRAATTAPSPEDRWLHFLAEAEGWRAVPPLLHSSPLEAAMTLLESIRANPEERAIYEAYCKQEAIRITAENALAAAEREREASAQALADSAQALADSERRRLAERAVAEQALAAAERAGAERALAAERAGAERALAAERAGAERALAAERAAEALRAKLRELGIDPDAVD